MELCSECLLQLIMEIIWGPRFSFYFLQSVIIHHMEGFFVRAWIFFQALFQQLVQ